VSTNVAKKSSSATMTCSTMPLFTFAKWLNLILLY
jgi:hypothetical protein